MTPDGPRSAGRRRKPPARKAKKQSKRRLRRGLSEERPGDLVTGVWRASPEQWARLREQAADPEQLGSSYEAWAARNQRRQALCEAQGYQVLVFELDPVALARWCAARDWPNDVRARTEFGLQRLSEELRRQDEAP